MKDPSAVQSSAEETRLDRHTTDGVVSVFYRERQEVKSLSLAPALSCSLKSEKKKRHLLLISFIVIFPQVVLFYIAECF